MSGGSEAGKGGKPVQACMPEATGPLVTRTSEGHSVCLPEPPA